MKNGKPDIIHSSISKANAVFECRFQRRIASDLDLTAMILVLTMNVNYIRVFSLYLSSGGAKNRLREEIQEETGAEASGGASAGADGDALVEDLAYNFVHSLAFAIALSSCFIHSSATSLAKGSLGFGDARRAWTDKRTVLICRAGDQLFFKTSRHILPNLSMFGW